MLLALTLWVSSALPVTEVARPAGAALNPVAQVLLSEAEVKIDPGGKQQVFKAERGMLLQASDVVMVAPGAWVALAILGNQQVVRLDDDLNLRVGDLALLNAPAQSTTVVGQLDTLLTARERERTERLIGWHASPTAANAPPVKSVKHQEKRLDDELSAAPRPTPPPTGGNNQEKTEASTLKQKEAGAPKGMGPGSAMKRDRIEPQSNAGLQACVEATAASWSAELKAKVGQSVKVDARLKDDEVLVRLPFGIPAPSCAVEYFKERGGLSPIWTSVLVPLK